MIEKGLITHLSTNSATIGVGDRVWAVLAPTDTEYPCVVYQKISEPEEYYHGGRCISRPRIQFSIYADTYEETKTIEHAIRDLLAAYQGTYDGKTVYSCFVDNVIDSFEPNLMKYRVIIDVIYQYE
jgi:hypothetical protein